MRRLSFLPTKKSREYFDDLVERLTQERGLDVRITQREAFEYMCEYAREAEHPKRQELARLLQIVKKENL
jgi:hypothetical protein